MGQAQVIKKYEGPLRERTWDNQKVLTSHTESQRFIPAMERIPYQGTSTRVLLYKCLLLMVKDDLVPELRLNDLNRVVDEVISNGWLDQPPAAAFTERIEKETLSLETITKRGKSKEHYLWGLAGAVASSGRCKQFQSTSDDLFGHEGTTSNSNINRKGNFR